MGEHTDTHICTHTQAHTGTHTGTQAHTGTHRHTHTHTQKFFVGRGTRQEGDSITHARHIATGLFCLVRRHRRLTNGIENTDRHRQTQTDTERHRQTPARHQIAWRNRWASSKNDSHRQGQYTCTCGGGGERAGSPVHERGLLRLWPAPLSPDLFSSHTAYLACLSLLLFPFETIHGTMQGKQQTLYVPSHDLWVYFPGLQQQQHPRSVLLCTFALPTPTAQFKLPTPRLPACLIACLPASW